MRNMRLGNDLPLLDWIVMKKKNVYVIAGITGNVGGSVARALLAAGQPVRAVVRNADKGASWAEQGCEVAVAKMNDAAALTAAFDGAQGVFVLPPPNFDPEPDFPEARVNAAAFRRALEKADPDRVVYLSTIGAQATKQNLLTQHTIAEEALSHL